MHFAHSSAPGRLIRKGGIPLKYYFVGDDAYSAAAHMCVPYSGHHEYRSPEDNYNFYQSSTRIVIECAFGMLVRRWGILWRKIEGRLKRVSKIVMTCMLLHNLILDFEDEDFAEGESSIPTVAPHHTNSSNATTADGVVPNVRAGRVVSHTITRPIVFAQNECSFEHPPARACGNTRNKCPHRNTLKNRLVDVGAVRPRNNRKREDKSH